jgi:voltage-gated potassium channel
MLLVPLVIIIVGSVGYPLIEGDRWSWFDGLYMTVITLTTLGYGEIPEPLSKPGRVFTMLLALGGIFTLFYFATEIVRSVVTGELRELLGRERMEDDLKHLNGHLIVCGYGRMGKIVCDELERQKRRYVVIDKQPQPADWQSKHGLMLQGDANEDEVLRRAGIDRAKALITVVGSDADNLYIVLSARLLNPKLLVVARAEEEEAEAKLRKVGANKVISPYLAGGHRAVQAVLRPSVLHFMEMATRPEFMDLQIEEVRAEATGVLVGKTLRDSRLSQDLGVIVIGILRPTGEVVYGPRGDAVIEAGATLIVIGRRRQLDEVELLAGVGGG